MIWPLSFAKGANMGEAVRNFIFLQMLSFQEQAMFLVGQTKLLALFDPNIICKTM